MLEASAPKEVNGFIASKMFGFFFIFSILNNDVFLKKRLLLSSFLLLSVNITFHFTKKEQSTG
jgi:hypothetical protein